MKKRSTGCTQTPIQWVREALSPGVDRPGSEAVSDVEVKNEWRYTYTPRIYLHGGCEENITQIFFFLSFVVPCLNKGTSSYLWATSGNKQLDTRITE